MPVQWQKPFQSIVAILITWAVGHLLALTDTFASTPLLDTLSLADLALLFARIAILALLLVLARQLQTVLPKNGKGSSFLRAVLTPLATLIILLTGQNVVLEVLDSFLSHSGEQILILCFWLAALGCTGWLIWRSYLHGPELVAGFIALGHRFSQTREALKTCPQCGAHLKEVANYCGYCGAPLTSNLDGVEATEPEGLQSDTQP